MTRKSCPYCYSTNINKHGVTRGKQRYLCRDCFTTWSNLSRPERFQRKLWREYAWEGRSVSVLSRVYGKSPGTIRKLLHSYIAVNGIDRPRTVVAIMDVTYFGPWGMLVVIDPNASSANDENVVLYWAEIDGTERTVDYEVATDTLEGMNYTLKAVVIDGRRGVRQMLERKGIRVQHCQFHQLQTITRCLTKRPKLEQNKELRAIALTLTATTGEVFEQALDNWHKEHGNWLKERYKDPLTGRSRYRHDRTRRAYFSLRRNLPYLFTCQDEQLTGDNTAQSLKVPNTTNALDGRFGVWKTKLKQHRGISKQLKITMLRSFFSERTD